MNRKIGMSACAVNVVAVVSFAVSMLIGSNFLSYFASLFIAFSFVPMMCAFAYFSKERSRLAGITAVAFAAIYAAIICLVYFAQLTTVRFGELTGQAAAILDFQKCGLYFNYDLLGYGMMALATFFAGLTVDVSKKTDKWLKGLLLGHGIFFFSCLIMPMLHLFTEGKAEWASVVALEFWCAYFVPIGVLSYRHFSVLK